jgi:hypothetical protein
MILYSFKVRWVILLINLIFKGQRHFASHLFIFSKSQEKGIMLTGINKYTTTFFINYY